MGLAPRLSRGMPINGDHGGGGVRHLRHRRQSFVVTRPVTDCQVSLALQVQEWGLERSCGSLSDRPRLKNYIVHTYSRRWLPFSVVGNVTIRQLLPLPHFPFTVN